MNTILIGNLIKIRWIAIFGQIFAIFFVSFVIKIEIPILETLSIILLSVAVNIFSYYEERKNKSISNIKTFYFLLFDIIQLGFLLFLTGGIINPFSILILAPVITSASYLPALMTVILSAISIIIIVILNFYFIPLNLGPKFFLPEIYSFGLVTALIIVSLPPAKVKIIIPFTSSFVSFFPLISDDKRNEYKSSPGFDIATSICELT